MNKLLKLLCGISAAVILCAAPAFADDAGSDGKDGKSVRGKSQEERVRELEEKLKDIGFTGVKGSGVKLSGYVDTSYLINLRGENGSDPIAGATGTADTAGNATATQAGGARVFDYQMDQFTLNAVKITLEKSKDDSDFPAGFRVDTIYGSDAQILGNKRNTAVANNGDLPWDIEDDSTFYLEQAYINLGIPVGDGIDVKIGKMVSLIGYEVIESPANANFSRSFAFGLAPFTQTGVTFGYNINDYVTATAGVINGPDNDGVDITNNFAPVNGGGNANTELSGVVRVDIKSPEWSFGAFNLGISSLFGNDSTLDQTSAGAGGNATTPWDDSTSISIVDVAGTWAKVLGHEPLSLGFEVFLLSQEFRQAVGGTGGFQENSQDDHIFALYAKYQLTDWLYVAGRGEYWDADGRTAFSRGIYNNQGAENNNQAFANIRPSTDQLSIYSGTLTAGFNVWKDTLVRLEWRHDETSGDHDGFINAQSLDDAGHVSYRTGQDTISVNVVYCF
jgi:putative OmpL-like beta-barrel porin-2